MSRVPVHVLRIDGWMTIIRPVHEGWATHRRLRWARFPLMTQSPKPSGAEDGVNARPGVLQKNFDTQLIPSLQPLVDQSGADAIVGTHADAQGSARCGQVATNRRRAKDSVSHGVNGVNGVNGEKLR